MSGAVLSFPLARAAHAAGAVQQSLAEQIPTGKLVELVGGAGTAPFSMAVGLVRHAQALGDTVAWIQPKGGSLFPPDLADHGVDVRSLIVVHIPRPAGALGLIKAAEILLRSSGFGWVVIDLSGMRPSSHAAWQGRLMSVARAHHCRVVCITAASSSPGTQAYDTSLGPLIDLRIATRRQRISPGQFALTHHLLKNKSGTLGELPVETRRGPWGLR